MPKKKKSKPGKAQGQGLPSVKPVPLTSVGRAKVTYGPQPPRPPEGKKIHARRPLPAVREAAEPGAGVQDQRTSTPVKKEPD